MQKYPKIIKFNEDVKKAILEGVDAVANAVKTTLGPCGRFVLFEEEYGNPVTTNDGVTVAKQIRLEDPVANMASQMVIEVASKTNDVSGDGTTTATVLAQKLVHEGLKNIAAGANGVHLVKGMKKASEDIINEIKKVAKKITTTDELVQVATISAGDESIGKLVSEAVNKVGKDGVVTIEEGQSSETVIEMVEGMQYDRGYLIPAFINDPKRMEVNYEECYVACIDMKINNVQEMLPLLEKIAKDGHPALLMINGEDQETLGVMAYNRLKTGLKIVATHSPAFGERKKEMHDDIAIITGGRVIGEEHGLLLTDVTLEQLGRAKRVIVTRDKTTIVGGNCDKKRLEERIIEIKSQLEINKSEYECDKLKERLAKITGGIAVINVGGVTETEMRARKYKIEDALNAAKSALEEGIVAGGGVCYIRIASTLKVKGMSDFIIGYNTVINAVKEPFKQIIANTGESSDAIYQKVMESTDISFGYDSNRGEYCNLFDKGIIDPAKTTRAALENAVSIASLLLTTDCLIALNRRELK